MNQLRRRSLMGFIQAYRSTMRSAIDAQSLKLTLMHVRCLKLISDTSDCTAKAITETLARDKSQISNVIRDMVGKGWVEKRKNERDNRSQVLVLTEQGRSLLAVILKEEAAVDQRMTRGVPDSDLATFDAVLTAMADNLSREESPTE